MKKIIFILIVLIIIFTRTTNKEAENYVKIDNEEFDHVSLIAVGDNLIHSTIYEAAKIDNTYDFKPIYSEIKDLVKKHDLRFINQETILGGSEIGLSTYPAFNSPYELGDALVDVGFNLISIANNHTLDRGEKGVINAINYLDNLPVIYSGAVRNENVSQVKLFNVNGIKFAFVAYTYGTNGVPHPNGKEHLANVYSNEKAKRDIKNVRNLVDVVIVSMHWGEEYQSYPNNTQKSQAAFLSSLGTDIIIGHHPHVIQPVDLIETNGKQTFVIYSLGNFLSDQKGIDRLIGMAVSLDIYKSKKTDEVSLKNKNAILLYRYKDKNKFLVKLFQDLDDEYLTDYLSYFEIKKKLIQTYYKEIEVN